MAAAVTTETGARGRLSELVLPVVVLADLALLLLFSLAMQFARGVLEPGCSRQRQHARALRMGDRRRRRLRQSRRRAASRCICATSGARSVSC